MVDKRGLGGLGGDRRVRPARADNPLPFIPSPPSLQDMLPEGWATEGWPAQWPPPPASATGPIPGFNENQPFPPRNEQSINFRPDQVGPYPKTYRNDLPPPPLPQAVMPPGWTPPLSLHQRIERGLEAQRQRRSEPPPARRQEPVLRRKKPQRPKARESEA